jgi:hypothetical protein
MASKQLRVEITGNANQLGAEAKKAQGYIDDLKREGLNRLSGGVLAGGAAAAVTLGIQALRTIVGEIRSILDRAERLNVSAAGARQLRSFSSALGVDEASVDSAVQQARKARSDALAGDDEAIRSFERLGLALSEIKDLSPDAMFSRILDAMSGADLDPQRFRAASMLLGSSGAEAFAPWSQSPGAFSAARAYAGGAEVGVQVLGAPQGLFGRAMTSLLMDAASPVVREFFRAVRKPFEPVSQFGVATEEQARDMAEQNQVKLNQATRAQLSDEQRINQALAERLRLITLIEAERDPVKRQKLLASAIQVENELGALAGKSAGGSGGSGGAFSRSNDSLRAIGADLSRFGPSLATRLQEQTNTEIRNMKQTLDQGLRRIEQELQRDL